MYRFQVISSQVIHSSEKGIMNFCYAMDLIGIKQMLRLGKVTDLSC